MIEMCTELMVKYDTGYNTKYNEILKIAYINLHRKTSWLFKNMYMVTVFQ